MRNLILPTLFAALAIAVTTFSRDTEARGRGLCGRECQRSMGSCTVNNELWQKLLTARTKYGIKATSCCRSLAYTYEMRSCGYGASRRSLHLTGNAVDLAIARPRCNKRSLAAVGMPDVCPEWHGNHCHVNRCGTARSAARYRAQGRREVDQIRSRNRQRARARVAVVDRNGDYHYQRSVPAYYYQPQQQQPPSLWQLLFGGAGVSR